MKILYSFLLVFFLSFGMAHSAEMLPDSEASCSVEVIADICGSGIVKLDFSGDRFTLNHGDIHCWNVDFQLKGSLKNPRRAYTRRATTVDLIIDGDETDNVIGQLTYRPKSEYRSSLATLNLESTKLIEERGGKHGIYHLSCH